MDNFRRIVSLLMTLVVMMFILLPSVAPPVQAVVGVDDAVLATSAVALLFLGLCGVTFASSSDAVAGVQAFLAKQADGAQRLATIASEYVKDGVLTLNSAVKEAFADIRTGIQDFFQFDADSGKGSVLSSGYVVGSPIQLSTSSLLPNGYSDMSNAQLLGYMPFSISMFYNSVITWKDVDYLPSISQNSDGTISVYFRSSSGSSLFSITASLTDRFNVYWTGTSSSDELYFVNVAGDGRFKISSGPLRASGGLYKIRPGTLGIVFTAGDIGFTQDQLVDGSLASSALDNAPDVSDTPLDDMPYLPIGAMTGVINRGQSESEEDQASAPGLIPEDLVKQLQDALAGGAVLPTNPAETEPTTGDDVIDPNLPITTGFWNKFFQGAKTWGEDVISGIGDKLKGIGEDIASGAQKVGETITSGVDVITSTLSDILEWIKSIPGQLLSGLEALFVPDMAALADTVLEMRAEYPFFDAILATGQAIGNAISASSGPPVVYVHLENDEGQFTYGGTVAVLDMSFYERYKSVGDVVISSFMLLAFAWRVFVKLPGIISGVPGDVQVFQNVAGEDRRKKK